MELIYNLLGWISDAFASVLDFIEMIPTMLEESFSYLQLIWIKLKVYWYIQLIQLSYSTATILLSEIGFNSALTMAFNSLPSEIRFYAFAFGIPKAISIYANFFTTAFVMRISRM
ncbi:DUF2523 family protein [Vibrio mediterranei]|uniref:DUF2523 domain-containing protein n=1 Tax=Vibrio mediterranei TaxID=689 RepID=A0A3G4V4W8_9VIBR|nr:DUF2523 family protein [Vibrio mediterranei]AYV19808.1 DUF2523 domain-containing protein [Vibrio mediterranei]AYV19816.1 DUF2523 domain-containing protein [Vibrio mediterranei]NOH31664.1 DUF2523 domain-containing protein [Vibrio mediterranei]NOI26354.1 DUF2523 domain-containing protein [Vibrio mediterranei]